MKTVECREGRSLFLTWSLKPGFKAVILWLRVYVLCLIYIFPTVSQDSPTPSKVTFECVSPGYQKHPGEKEEIKSLFRCFLHTFPTSGYEGAASWGTWGAQLVKHLTSAQVMISLFVDLSPASGSVLTAQSLEPASDSVSPSLSLSSPFVLSLSLSLSQK